MDGVYELIRPRVAWWHWRWIWGLPADIWVTRREFIGAFIKEHQLQRINPDHLYRDDPVPIVGQLSGGGTTEASAAAIRWPQPFPGGIRAAHLHFEGHIYPVNPEQWRVFSTELVADFRERLNKVETVSFGEMMELSGAIEKMGR